MSTAEVVPFPQPERPLAALAESWELSLRAAARSPRTIQSYMETVGQLDRWLADQGVANLEEVTRQHLRTYLLHVAERTSNATGAFRHRTMRPFFRWLVAEGELDRSPLDGVEPPKVVEQPVEFPSDDDLRALLRACEGRTLAERRDAAILRLFADAGLRLSELVGLDLEDVDLSTSLATIRMAKGGRIRVVPFGVKTAQALDRYLRVRGRRPGPLFVSSNGGGRLSQSGVTQMLRRRCRQAEIPQTHPHALRHAAAHAAFAAGLGESDAMQHFGWRSTEMTRRYGSALAAERAREAMRRHSPGDRL